MKNYPIRITDTKWIIEVRDTRGTYREMTVDLKRDSLYQMGWDLGKENNNEQN